MVDKFWGIIIRKVPCSVVSFSQLDVSFISNKGNSSVSCYMCVFFFLVSPSPLISELQVLCSYPSNPPNNHVDRCRQQGTLVNGIQSGNQSSFYRGGDASTLQYISRSVLGGQDRQIVPNTKGNMSTERTQ